MFLDSIIIYNVHPFLDQLHFVQYMCASVLLGFPVPNIVIYIFRHMVPVNLFNLYLTNHYHNDIFIITTIYHQVNSSFHHNIL